MFRVPELGQLKYIAEAAARVDDAVGGLVSLVDASSDTLVAVAHWGCPAPFIKAVASIPRDAMTSCAQAARERRRVVIRDVRSDPAFAPYLSLAETAGFRGVQSTPLIDRQRKLVGVLSTLFADPHHPSTRSLKEIDSCARVATLLIEAAYLHEAAANADRRLGIPPRALSLAASQEVDAVRMLLPALARDGGISLLAITERHLTAVVDELSQQLRWEGSVLPV